MNLGKAFEQQSLTGAKLKNYIRDAGYTKISFSRKANISVNELNEILNGMVNNKLVYENYLKKILAVLEICLDDLLSYDSKKFKIIFDAWPEENSNHDRQIELLMDIVDLSAIYF